jgi:hypothetical protein
MPVQPERAAPRMLSPAESLSNQAAALHAAYCTDEAVALARRSVAMEHTPTTLNNLAVILETLGLFEESLSYAREAYHHNPDVPRTARLYGEALLRLGNLPLGWPIYSRAYLRYDWLSPHVPEWHGESLADRRLLVFGPGGYGDNIYFLRWLPDLAARGATVTYLSPPMLAPLARLLPIHVVENWNGNVSLDFGAFDYHISIHAIPQYLNVTYDTYTPRVPYFPVRPHPRFHLRHRIGFCWRGGEALSPRYSRSLNWDQRQRITARLPRRYVDLSNLTGSWLATARLIASLDHLITVDTGVAHLAGALGVPTSVILPGSSAWYYPLGYDRHPFYPTMHMFRNEGEGLDSAVNAICGVL